MLRASFDDAAQATNKELFDEIGRLKGAGPYGKNTSSKKLTDDEKTGRQIEIDKLCLELVRDSKFHDAFQSRLEGACPEMFEPKSLHSLLERFESDGDGLIICES
ncbi:MAG: hypothetical protein Q4B45_04115 [Coriobacteriia bacterium]|nr:hypothetical protein [Coriobacteriia bacterium]